MKFMGIIVGLLILCMVSVASADSIQVNNIYATNASNDNVGWFTSGNLTSIEGMTLNFTINASADRIITNVSLNFTSFGAGACALGNLQEDYCYNYYNTTTFKWVEFVSGNKTSSFDDVGSVGDSINETRLSDGQNMTVIYLIDEHYNPNVFKHYGAVYNFSNVKYQSDSSVRITKNNYIRALSGDFIVDSSADYYKLDARFNTSTALDTDSLYAYMCNSTYNETAGNVETTDNCRLVCAKTKAEFSGTKFRCLFTGALLDNFGDGKNVSIVYLSDILATSRYFAMKTFNATNVSHGISWQYSTDSGTTWLVPTDGYETETNINHFFAGTNVTAFKYQVIATNNNSEKTVLEGNVTWDLEATVNYPPRVAMINPKNNKTLRHPVNITISIADGSNDPLNYSLLLYNRDMSLNTTIRENMNRSNLSYVWDDATVNGDYILTASVCETNTTELYCDNESHFLTIGDIKVTLNYVIPLDSNFTYLPGFNSTNLPYIEYMLLNYTLEAVGNTKILNVSFNFTAGGDSPCALGNKQDSICYNYYNDTYKWIEFKNDTETPTFDGSSTVIGDTIVQVTSGDGQNMSVSFLIDEHYNPNVAKAYSALFNYSDIKWQNETYNRLTKTNMIRVCSKNMLFPYDADQYRIDTRLNPSDTIYPEDTLYAYICNATYNTTFGDPNANPNCAVACQKDASELQDTEKFRCVFTKSVFDDIGPSACVVLSTDIANPNRYFSLRTFKALNTTRDVIWQYSSDSGDTWNYEGDDYETELNVNWFYDGVNTTSFIYNVKVTNNDSVFVNSEGNLTWDINPDENYRPTAYIITPAQNETLWFPYNVTFNIWDPNSDNLNATLYHYHNGTEFLVATNMNATNISVVFNEVHTGENASFVLQVCELGTADLFCENSSVVFDMIGSPPVINSFSVNASDVYQGAVVLFTINVTAGDNALDDVWVTIRGSVVNITNAVDGVNYLSYTADDFYGNYSVAVYVNDSVGLYNSTNSLYLSVESLKGIVPEDSGSPFYTSTDNPYECGQMWEGQVCEVSYLINSTGDRGFDYEFFAWANGTEGVSNTSDSFYVTTIVAIPNSTGSMSSNDSLYCNITFGDYDGDSVAFVNSTIGWYQNHTVMKNGSLWLNCSENDSWCEAGNNVFCFACVEDEHGYIGGCNQSYSLTVSNLVPSLTPYITPAVPEDGSNLVCNENASDPEGHSLIYTYRWFINGSYSGYTSRTIGNLATDVGDEWLCQVTVFDSVNYAVANSSSVVIGGACPSLPVLLYPPNWTQVSGIPVEFDWANSSIAGGADIYYFLQVSNVSDFSTTTTDISIIPSEYSSNDSFMEDIYYWRVRAESSGCYSNWTKSWLFSYVNGTCNDGIKNYHDGEQEDGVDCGGSCDECTCASSFVEQVDIAVHTNISDVFYRSTNITTLDALEIHCRDGCFEPQFGESDTDCGGFGAWACPDCGIGQNCTSNYECADGLFCQKADEDDTFGVCADNAELVYCSNGIYNPTLDESDIDCGGPCDSCDEGDRCVSTLDCRNDLVCNQYDICVVQTDELTRKRGRQLGAIATEGLSMNQAFCSGINDRYYQISADEMINYATCPVEVGDSGQYNRYTYVIDTTGLDGFWSKIRDIVKNIETDKYSGLSPVVRYRIAENTGVSGEFKWLWLGTDGQEFNCKDDDGVVKDSVCEYLGIQSDVDTYTCKSAAYNSMICNQYFGDGCDYHCDTFGPSDSFAWSTDAMDSPDDKHIFNTGCMFVGLCPNTRYRMSAQVLLADGTKDKSLPEGNDEVIVEFTTNVDDGGVIRLEEDQLTDKGTISNDYCAAPTYWDITGCDGQDINAGDFDYGDDENMFYAVTGCSYQDTMEARYKVITQCEVPLSEYYGDDTDRLKSYPLADFGCDGDSSRITSAVLDFTAIYEQYLKPDAVDVNGDPSKYAYDYANKLKAIHLLITRNSDNGQECLVYDNLLSNAYKYQPTSIDGYFNLYHGGDFVDRYNPGYGPRVKLPLCESGTYNVLLYYIPDVSENPSPPGGYDSVLEYYVSDVRTTIVRLGGVVYDYSWLMPQLGITLYLQNFLNELFGINDGIDETKCRAISESVCADRGTIKDMMQETTGSDPLLHSEFILSKGVTLADDTVSIYNSIDDSNICYADYLIKFNGKLNFGIGYDDPALIDDRMNMSVNEWLFGDVDEAGVAGKATLTDTDAWVSNFFTIFNPFDVRPPIGLEVDKDGNTIFSFGKFIKSILYMLFKNPFGLVVLFFKLILYYVAKYMFWILAYALISYLWIRAMPNVSIYWLLFLFLFVAIIIFGWWASYSDFVDMFRVV